MKGQDQEFKGASGPGAENAEGAAKVEEKTDVEEVKAE